MADEIVRGIGFGGWDVRVFDGVPRVSGTELGQKLEYTVTNPALFNSQVIEKWRKEGKLNDSDMVFEKKPCRRGFGRGEKTEPWLTFAQALQVAMEVRTGAAESVRQNVIDYLKRQLGTPALPPASAAPALTLEQTENLTAIVMQAVGEKIIGTMTEALMPLSEMVERVHGLYIDQDRRMELRYLARRIVQESLAKTSARDLWKGTRERYRFRPGPTFSTVHRTKFEEVQLALEEQLTRVQGERRKKEQEEAKQAAKDQKRRAERIKDAKSKARDNVVTLPKR